MNKFISTIYQCRHLIYIKIIGETVYSLSIYSKGEKDNISEDEIDDLLADYEE